MTPRLNRFLLSAPLALAVPAVALWKADAPFGWWHVLAVYLLATLPLSMVLAEWIAVRTNLRWATAVSAILGIALVLATWFAGKQLTDWLYHDHPDFVIRQSALGVWCVLLQLPLCLVGQGVSAGVMKNKPDHEPAWGAMVLSLFISATLPTVYLLRTIEVSTTRAEEFLRQGQPFMAGDIARRLLEVGSTRLLAGKSLRYVWLEPLIGSESWGYRKYLRGPTTDAEHMELAIKYAGWGEFDMATDMLLHVASRDPAAALLLASVYKKQGKLKEATQYCELTLALLDRVPPSDAAIMGRVQAYDNLAAIAQEQKRYDEARTIYEQALRRVPPAEAHFHYQLGRLHHRAGRPGKALHHLETAQRLDPEGQTEKTQKLLDDIRIHTPACVLRWFGP